MELPSKVSHKTFVLIEPRWAGGGGGGGGIPFHLPGMFTFYNLATFLRQGQNICIV